MAIDGVLTIFAVPRKENIGVASQNSKKASGMSGIYSFHESWDPTVEQSERARAMFLSSLRVFFRLIKTNNSAKLLLDSVLQTLHMVTNFPPALRTVQLLASGMTPSDMECAALAHAIYVSIKKFVPLNGIGFGADRIFEGSRLFFGLILDKSKTHKLRSQVAMHPYLTSMKIISLTNSETMENLKFPINTNIGILERGCFDALHSGIIKFANTELR